MAAGLSLCILPRKWVQWPRPEQKIGDKSHQIPPYSPVCPRGQPPGMAADKCIMVILWPVVFIGKLAEEK